jgi:hypothetical protein
MKDAKLLGKIVLYGGIPFMLVVWLALAAVHKNAPGDISVGFGPLAGFTVVICLVVWLLSRGDIDRKPLIKDTLKIVGGIFLLLALLSLVVIGPWMPDSIRYAWMYGTNGDHVHVQKKPTDCEWGRAPIGDKGCHYEKQVETERHGNGQLLDVYVTWQRVQD